MDKKTLKDVELGGKRVVMRVDFNVPIKEGVISDDTRVTAALPSIRYVLEQGASLVLMSHLGRPKGKGYEAEFSLKPVADHLAKLLGKSVDDMFRIINQLIVAERAKLAAAAPAAPTEPAATGTEAPKS